MYLYISVKLYNKVPVAIRDTSCAQFKKVMVQWLKDMAFYSVDEMLCCTTQ